MQCNLQLLTQYNLLRRRLERWSNFKKQVSIYCHQREKFQQHFPYNLWESDFARIFLFCFRKIFVICFQQKYNRVTVTLSCVITDENLYLNLLVTYQTLSCVAIKFHEVLKCLLLSNGWIIFSRLNTIKK